MLSINPSPSITGFDPTDAGLTTPAFRQELAEIAPHLLDNFDSISRTKNEIIEEYGRRYNEAKADLTKKRARALSDESSRRGNSISKGTRPGSSSTNDSSIKGFGRSPTTNTDSSASLGGFPQPQLAERSKHRIALSDSTRSKGTRSEIDDANTEVSSSLGGFDPPQAAVKAKQRIALSDSTKSHVTRGETSSARPRPAVTASEAILTMRVQIRLLPVIQILTASDLTPASRLRAQELAQAALHYANECNASLPLTARCSFYIAHTYYDPDDRRTTQVAVTWFERALEASDAGYPEGQWAQIWLNRYQSVNLAADSRPGTASSWLSGKVGSVWNMLRGSTGSTASSPPISPSAPVLAPAPKPRPSSIWRLYSNDGTRATSQNKATGERIPSFSTLNTSSTSPTSGTQDQYGVKWSPKSPFDAHGRRFDLVQSPEPINEEDEEEEEEQHIPANVLGGLVEAGSLSPAMQRSPPTQQQPSRRRSDYYVPLDHQKYRIANLPASPPESLNSPGSVSENKKQSPTRSFYFAPTGKSHSRTQSLAYTTSSSLPPQLREYAQSERASSPSSVSSRNRKRKSLSLFVRGIDVHRRRDEAAQMEEGESPAFAPRREEEGLYRRRSNDVVEEEM